MFLEKHSRFVRLYEFAFKPRHKRAAIMSLIAPKGEPDILDALRKKVKTNDAKVSMANNDVIELVKVEHDEKRQVMVLLFHRGSPDAADPTYRKRVNDDIHLRVGEKEEDEEQSVSAHLIISTKRSQNGKFLAILEEIPGLSMGIIQPIITRSLMSYPYQYEDEHGEPQETYCVLKAEGVKSASVEEALRTGKMKFLTLVRPYKANYIDDDDRLEPENEKLRIKIKAGVAGTDWMAMFSNLIEKAKEDGWQEFKVDIDLDNDRSRQVVVGRDQDAKEVLFIKSEQVAIATEMKVCSTEVRYDFVDAAVEKLL